ncbi:MAG TPA: ABC transporter substrate-binding protein, partial [Candidatus Binatia bacterium]|nr:ABC transporter substrate-binding protein [Candidatus Binatia bacterium]
MNAKRTVAVLMALAMGAAACSGSPKSAAPIRVGAIYPLTGSQARGGGIDEFRGVKLAADIVNRAGGVGGRPVRLVPVDVPGTDAVPGAIGRL